jgi:hypothetical protein
LHIKEIKISAAVPAPERAGDARRYAALDCQPAYHTALPGNLQGKISTKNHRQICPEFGRTHGARVGAARKIPRKL